MIIMTRLTDWLESISLPEPATEMELSLEIGSERGQKLYLLPQQGRREKLSRLAKLLKVRFGYQPLKGAVVRDPDALLPERRFKFIDF
jgi:hypothetical protein